MPKDRKADVFAGQGSYAGALRARRQAIEAGRPEDAATAFRLGLTQPGSKKPGKPKPKR